MSAQRVLSQSRHVTTLDIAWAAGFLEGEGWFSKGCKNGDGVSFSVGAAQVQREPLDRLQSMFGGKIVSRVTKGFSNKPIWVWTLNVGLSAQVSLTLYCLMSPKRKAQIEGALTKWIAVRRMRASGSRDCIRGHRIIGTNAVVVRGRRYSICRECRNMMKRARRAKCTAVKNA